MNVDEDLKRRYLAAWDDWQKQLQHLHRVFLEGEPIRPDQLKGLLNREAKKKDAYDALRLELLGLNDSPLSTPGGDGNPFKGTDGQ